MCRLLDKTWKMVWSVLRYPVAVLAVVGCVLWLCVKAMKDTDDIKATEMGVYPMA